MEPSFYVRENISLIGKFQGCGYECTILASEKTILLFWRKRENESTITVEGNVSKLLSGMQQPTLDTIYNIAKVYDVSVDWLLGISENKKRIETDSYASIILMLMNLEQHEAIVIEEGQNGRIRIQLEDPLIRTLIKKGLALYGADRELYQRWTETKLSGFADKRLLYSSECIEGNVHFRLLTTSTESEWLANSGETERPFRTNGAPIPF